MLYLGDRSGGRAGSLALRIGAPLLRGYGAAISFPPPVHRCIGGGVIRSADGWLRLRRVGVGRLSAAAAGGGFASGLLRYCSVPVCC